MKKGILSKTIEVLRNPSGFFDEVKKEIEINNSIKFLAVILIISSVEGAIVNGINLWNALAYYETVAPEGFVQIFILIISAFTTGFVYVISFIAVFIHITLTHFIAKIFGFKKGINETTKAVIYGSTPSFLVLWIPFAYFAGMLYSIYLSSLGMSKLHEKSIKKSVLIVLTVSALEFAIIFVLYGFNLDLILGPFASQILGIKGGI
ncbi:YIP1 family protein [Candidatus Micrarchaeota archaeon]|nr:YIP1 family protein [Candidatus Micrarchaeota archaeon]